MTTSPPELLIKAIRKVLKPMVRLLMNFQVTFPFLAEMLKGLYVEVAENEFSLDNKKQTDTRISLLTGVHRKDTKRLRAELKQGVPTPEMVSIGSQLVARWLTDPQWQDENGVRPLLIKGEFETLVQSVAKQDMRARVVLDEWLRLGIVQLEGDKVRLINDAFVPKAGMDEKAFFFGMNLADHLQAAATNLTSNEPPFFERCVYYQGLSLESVIKLQRESEELAMTYLKAMNERALSLQQLDKSQGEYRFNTGVYVYQEQDDEKD